jgi:hypothetical protein
MELLYARCAGLDVHATNVACVRIATGGAVTYEYRTVPTTTRGLLELADWLTARACTHVVLESTGVYWKPVWHVLEGQFSLTLATRCTSATYRVARVTRTTPRGSPICWRWD